MTRHRPLVAIAVLAALLGWLLSGWEPTRRAATEVTSALDLAAPPQGGDFTLDSAAGPVRLSDLRGQVVLLYFGYTTCPDICPTNLAFLAAALRELTPDELQRVRVLFVSVDPERDDLPRLAVYAAYFHPNIQGVTGTPEQVAQAAAQYGAAYRRTEQTGSAVGYLVDHSAYTYIVDPAGHLVQTLDHATPPERILAVMRRLLAVTPSKDTADN